MNPIDTSTDVFYRGRFAVVQPRSGGHRAGMDALLLAACVDADTAGAVADFGAGCGAAGLAVASRCPSTTIALVERDPTMAQIAAQSIELPQNTKLANRISVCELDLAAPARERQNAGLEDNSFVHVIANPPFNGPSHRPSPDSLKRDAHVLMPDTFEKWTRSAAACLQADGQLTMIVRAHDLASVVDAFANRFGDIAILSVHPKIMADAHRIIIQGKKGSRAPLRIRPALVLHDDSGEFLPMPKAIFDGEQGIDFAHR